MAIVALLEVLVKEILAAEEKFLRNPKDFYSLETAVKTSAENFSAGFLGAVLSGMNEQLCQDSWRKLKYNICCHDKRTLITTVGDVVPILKAGISKVDTIIFWKICWGWMPMKDLVKLRKVPY